MTTKLMARVAFGVSLGDREFTSDADRDFELDAELAADELRKAGYQVFLLPDKYIGRLAHLLDDFIEAAICGPNDFKVIDAIMNEVDAIVRKHGGACFDCGPIERDYVPFADMLNDTERG